MHAPFSSKRTLRRIFEKQGMLITKALTQVKKMETEVSTADTAAVKGTESKRPPSQIGGT